MKRYIQYGCGFTAPAGWINYDASPTLRFERLPVIGRLYVRNSQRFPANVRYGDIVKGLPETAASCDGIFCSHVLEHLCYADFQEALKNTYSILKPGGIFRGVVPDLKAAALKYIESYADTENPASALMRDTMLGLEERPRSLAAVVKSMFGNSRHLWMWDYKSLSFELAKAGFVNIRECSFGDSADPAFQSVEAADRFFAAAAFECSK